MRPTVTYVKVESRVGLVFQKICQTLYYGMWGAVISGVFGAVLNDVFVGRGKLGTPLLITCFIITEILVILSVWRWEVFISGDTTKLPTISQ